MFSLYSFIFLAMHIENKLVIYMKTGNVLNNIPFPNDVITEIVKFLAVAIAIAKLI